MEQSLFCFLQAKIEWSFIVYQNNNANLCNDQLQHNFDRKKMLSLTKSSITRSRFDCQQSANQNTIEFSPKILLTRSKLQFIYGKVLLSTRTSLPLYVMLDFKSIKLLSLRKSSLIRSRFDCQPQAKQYTANSLLIICLP